MNVVLGHGLDKGSYPDAIGDQQATLGNVVVGPAGLLGILETRLGRSTNRPHEAVRIGRYLKLLKQYDDGQRFYSKSLVADEWSTSKTLLTWRDELKVAGWNGEAPSGASVRLKTFDELEKLSQNELIEGIGERLQSILSILNRCEKLDIKHIQLVEPLESWSSGWRKLVESLTKCGVDITGIASHLPHSAGDLGHLQESLMSGNGNPCNEIVTGDGSLCVVRTPGEWEACETVASLLEVVQKSDQKTLIINGSGSHLLDDILNRHNLPRLGYDSRSRWRTALQILPLVLSNYWKPLDAQKLLEFLLIPKSPISRDVGICLEKALRENPGIGGPKWNEGMSKALALYESQSPTQKMKPQSTLSIEEYRKELSFWLGESEQFIPEEGLPSGVIMEVCSRLNKWASKRGGQDKDVTLIASAKLFNDVAEAIQDSGLTKITQPQLSRILDSVIGEGLERPDYTPQSASWSVVDSPAQVWGVSDTIIWWNFTSDGVSPLHVPWTSHEKESLRSAGVELRETSEMRLQESNSWRNAVKFAGKRLILLAPCSIAGTTVNYHPFWDEIRHLLNLDQNSLHKLTFDGTRIWRENSPRLVGAELIREPLKSIEIPEPNNVWLVPKNRLKGKDKESYSSVQKLIECPLAWVCEYVLGLHPGALASLPDRGQMLGTLSHAVIEKTLGVRPLASPQSAEKLSLDFFDELVPQMASPLLLPERKSELERVRGLIGTAARILVEHIHSSGFEIRNQEDSFERDLNGDQKMTGRIDLVLGDNSNDKLVLDLKWSNQALYKRDELKNGAFQLAVYAWLLRNAANVFPAGAYYLLAQGELITSACDFISPECVFPDADLEKTWDQGMESYKIRLCELQNGKALATGVTQKNSLAPQSPETAEIDSAASSFELKPKCEWCQYSTLCGMGVS